MALLCGTVLAGANFAKLMLLDRMVFHNPITVTVAAVICLTLVCTVFAAKIVGCMLPLLAKKIGFDPAVIVGAASVEPGLATPTDPAAVAAGAMSGVQTVSAAWRIAAGTDSAPGPDSGAPGELDRELDDSETAALAAGR